MALWRDSGSAPAPATAPASTPQHTPTPTQVVTNQVKEPFARELERSNVAPLSTETPRRERAAQKESVIASDLTIEGKIVGSGHVRIAGRFKGDVQIEGNLTIEEGAHLTGQVRANTVIVSGELHGNIENARQVELLQGGAIVGDVKAGSLTVAAGARMRGQVEFGWGEEKAGVELKGVGNAG